MGTGLQISLRLVTEAKGADVLFDIGYGTHIDANVPDIDGDVTMAEWDIPAYTLHVNVKDNEVHGHDWPSGAMVTLVVDIPGMGVYYTATKNADEDPSCGYPCFYLPEDKNLQVDQVVTLSDGIVTKTVHVSSLHVLDANPINDTVSGTAGSFAHVTINVNSQSGQQRQVILDADENWTVDYSVPGSGENEQDIVDIVPGDSGRAIILNNDGTDDGTLEYWNISNPYYMSCLDGNGVSGHVYGPDGTTPLEGAWVVVENAATHGDQFGVQTNASGYYQCGLPDGDFHLKAFNDQYSTVFYEQTYPDTAAVVVMPGGPLTADFTLDTPTFVFDNLIFNMDDPIVSDLAIRQAIAHGTNRQGMVDATFPSAVVLNTFEPDRYWAVATSGLPCV